MDYLRSSRRRRAEFIGIWKMREWCLMDSMADFQSVGTGSTPVSRSKIDVEITVTSKLNKHEKTP